MNNDTKLPVKKQATRNRIRKPKPFDTKFSTRSPEMEYWVGFLMADGYIFNNVRNNSGIGLKLALKDIGHVGKFKAFMEATQSIQIEKPSSGVKLERFNLSQSAKIRISSPPAVQDLAKYGVVPKKTGKEMVIGLELSRDFWRGVIDGDGSIVISNGIPYLHLCGSESLVTQFANYVNRLTGASITCKPAPSYFKTMCSGRVAQKMCTLLYNDANVSLDRKHEKARQAMRFEGYSKKS